MSGAGFAAGTSFFFSLGLRFESRVLRLRSDLEYTDLCN
jgi:hypothetical protein